MPAAVDGFKECTKCGDVKPVIEFGINRAARDGLNSRCKPCSRESQKINYQNRLEHNRQRNREQRKAWAKTEGGKVVLRGLSLRKWGLTQEDFDILLEAQKGGCAICGSTDPKNTNWCIDHDHSCCPSLNSCCGRCVRGLLCAPCNAGLGMFYDSVDLLEAAKRYLLGIWTGELRIYGT